ncbi:replication protein [Geobacillus thermoleovorans]|uniref:phage tail protein n=1 Tax=Geobacillus thermoleovorans TaxID=33941 RepID=UPI0016803846|nr:phage tail tape measure protein [Geobacillus thermoleovorans]QNU22338.1 replication protein [Geobacillus thermoleovorans]
MAETVRGINVVISGDTTKLGKALEDVNKKGKEIQGELRQVERLLRFDPSNTTLLAQKQQLLAKQIENTSEKLNRLKSVQQQVNEQFQRGEISEGQYRAFQREIEKTQQELRRFQDALRETEEEQKRIAQSTRQLETLFAATGKTVDDFSDALGSKLVNAIKNGTASSKQLDEAIAKIGQAALGTNVDLDKLKAALASVDDGNSLKNVQKELNKLATEAKAAEKSVEGLGSQLESVAGALVAGGGIAGAIEKALDVTDLEAKINVAFDVPESSKKAIKEAVRSIEAYGVDAEAALEGVRRQWALNKNASDEANTAIVKGAAAVARAYSGIDFTELIQETHEIASELNITNEEALGLVNSLLKIGFPPEQLDIIAEYGQQLQRAGFEAEEIQAIFAAGVETGTWNIDNLLDGLKEGRIRLAEFGQEVDKSTKELLQGTGISAKQLQEWGQAVAAGGDKGREAMQQVAKALSGVKDETKRNALGVAIFGTMWEDQGSNITETILNMDKHLGDAKNNTDNLKNTVAQIDESPAVKLQQAFQDLKTASEPLLGVIADVVSKIAEWVSENPTLAATITAVVSAIGIILGAMMALTPIFASISALIPILGAAFAALTGPIGIAVAAIAGIIAIGVLLWKNWDKIKAFLLATWEAIKAAAKVVWDGLKSYFTTMLNIYKTIFTTVWNAIKTALTTVWNAIKRTASTVFNAIKTAISTIFNAIRSVVTSVWNGIKSTLTSIWNGLKSTASSVWNGIKSLTSSVWSGIKSAISSAVNAAKSAVSNAFSAMKNAVSSIMSGIKSTIVSMWNSAVSYLRGINLYSIGRNIIQGLANGIKAMAGAVYQKAREIADKVKNTIKKALGIHSPSRVMRDEVGVQIGAGIADGIRKSSAESTKAARDHVKDLQKAISEKIKNLEVKFDTGKISASKYISELKKFRATTN